MNRNPLMPFALIAGIGLTLMLTLSFTGLNTAEKIALETDVEEEPTTGDTASTPEELYSQGGCIGCHGGNYEGGIGPSLTQVGGKYSAEEIAGIINNGRGSMPGGLLGAEQSEALANWLAEKK